MAEVRVAEGHSFAIVPDFILMDPQLGPGPKLLYAIYALHADNQTGACWPSTARLAEMTGKTSSTIQRWRKDLAERGHITVERRWTGDVETTPLVTIFRHPPDSGGTPSVGQGTPQAGQGTPLVRNRTRPMNQTNELEQEPLSDSNESDVALCGYPTLSEAILGVFTHWRQTLHHPRAKLDAKRRRVIKARLEDGYSVDDLKMAVDGVLLDAHKMGDNDRGRRYDSVELIFRNADQVDHLMALATQGLTKAPARKASDTVADGLALLDALDQTPPALEGPT